MEKFLVEVHVHIHDTEMGASIHIHPDALGLIVIDGKDSGSLTIKPDMIDTLVPVMIEAAEELINTRMTNDPVQVHKERRVIDATNGKHIAVAKSLDGFNLLVLDGKDYYGRFVIDPELAFKLAEELANF